MQYIPLVNVCYLYMLGYIVVVYIDIEGKVISKIVFIKEKWLYVKNVEKFLLKIVQYK